MNCSSRLMVWSFNTSVTVNNISMPSNQLSRVIQFFYFTLFLLGCTPLLPQQRHHKHRRGQHKNLLVPIFQPNRFSNPRSEYLKISKFPPSLTFLPLLSSFQLALYVSRIVSPLCQACHISATIHLALDFVNLFTCFLVFGALQIRLNRAVMSATTMFSHPADLF